jgi:hypothetical protein
MDGRLGGPRASLDAGEEKNISPCLKYNPLFLCCPARSPVTIPTESAPSVKLIPFENNSQKCIYIYLQLDGKQ